jgi:fructose-1-phosphate kinase PfkB-like protein
MASFTAEAWVASMAEEFTEEASTAEEVSMAVVAGSMAAEASAATADKDDRLRQILCYIS